MIYVQSKANQLDLALTKAHRRGATDRCPACGCHAIWAKSYHAWNWNAEPSCQFCSGEAAADPQTAHRKYERDA